MKPTALFFRQVGSDIWVHFALAPSAGYLVVRSCWHDGWTQVLRARAGSRRRESRNPERHRAGKREEVEICIEALKRRKESAGKYSATQGLFPLPRVVTLIMGLGTTYLFLFYQFGKPWVPPHLRRC